jgi:hypothetical protein
MLENSLRRLIFVIRIRLSVARSNFNLERAFGRLPLLDVLPKYAAISGVVLLAVVFSVFHFNSKKQVLVKNIVVASKPAPKPQTRREVISQGTPITQPTSLQTPQELAIRPDHFVLAVDKSKKLLFVLKEFTDAYQVVKIYDISLGRKIGAKEEEGDLKTPSGFYQIVDIKEGRDLPEMYGPRAFVTNYPNRYDIAKGRSGGGIWVHGSKTGTRTLDSHGCVVLDNANLMRLEEWVHKNTPIAIFPEEFSLPVVGGKVEKKFISAEFFYGEEAKTLGPITSNSPVTGRIPG